jgi:UDP-N-acetylmuramate--alanine ligase
MFAQTNIGKTTELVVLSRYYDDKHIEATTAIKQKLTVITETELTKQLSDTRKRIAVLGEYESPVLSAWLAHVWHGGHIPVQALTHALAKPYRDLQVLSDAPDWFILPFSGFKRDAVTYEPDFLSFDAQVALVPSIRYTYPELYMTLDEVYQSYYAFVKRVPRAGLIIGNSDYPRMKRLRVHLADRHIETYGFDRDAMWHIREVEQEEGSTTFSLAHDKQLYGPFTIPFRGEVSVYAAAAVSVLSLLHDMKPATLARGLATLPALERYFETVVDAEGRTIILDRADHPETIEMVLKTVRELYPTKKIWCVYQPCSFLQTKALQSELHEALALADFVYIADIKGYPKEKSEGLHTRHVVAAMKQSHPQTYYCDESIQMSELLAERVTSTDCIVLLGHEYMMGSIITDLLNTSNGPEIEMTTAEV